MKVALKRSFEKARSTLDKFQDESKRPDAKATPIKAKTGGNKKVQQKIHHEETTGQSPFGSPLWCAAMTQCINKTVEANDDYRCYLCKLFVHPECTQKDNEGRPICIRCKEIGAYDDIMELEASVIEPHDGADGSNYINIEGDDPTTNSTETEVANNTSTLDENSVNTSGITTNENKEEIIQFIINNGITKRSVDKYVHMIANITGVKINFEDINESALEQYATNIIDTMNHSTFDKKTLYGNNFKVFMKAMGIKLPRGNHHRKLKDAYIKKGFEMLPLLRGSMVKSRPALQDMPKITGVYLTNNSMPIALKETTINQVISKLKTMKTEEVKMDQTTFSLLQLLKTTTERVLNPNTKFGDITWCAMGKDCTNHTIPAPVKLKCMMCKESVHQLCGKGESFVTFECFKCIENNSKPAAVPKEPMNGLTTSNPNTVQNECQATPLTFGDFDNDKGTNHHYAETPKRQTTRASKQVMHTVNREHRNTQMPFDDFENDVIMNEKPTLTTRFDIRFNIRPRNEIAEFKDVLRAVVELTEQLKHSDPTIQVIPWYAKKFDANAALDLERPPKSIQELNRYFPRIRIQDGNSWGDMCIVHSIEHYDIIAICEVWLDHHGHGMYKKRLQCVATAPVGWMLWSFRAIDTRVLSEKLEEMFNIQVDFRFAAITTERFSNTSTNPIRALHAWIPDDKNFRKTKAILQQTYGSKATKFPLDIKLRLVPMLKHYWSSDRIMKFKKLKSRQGSFLKAITMSSCRSGDILNLDAPTGGLPTLRSLIMSERIKDGSCPIFLSVDYAYKRDDLVVCSFLPKHEGEAREFVTNIAAHMILKYKSNPAIYEYFTPDSYDMIEDVEWDADNQRIITSDEKYLDDFEFLDDELMMFDEMETDTPIIANTPTTRIEQIFLGQTEDSVGTLRTLPNSNKVGFTSTVTPGSSNAPRTSK